MQYQYNKTSLQQIEKGLQMRRRALPTLQNKESYLRLQVRQTEQQMQQTEKHLHDLLSEMGQTLALFSEMPAGVLSVRDVLLSSQKVGGCVLPCYDGVVFDTQDISVFDNSKWLYSGIDELKRYVECLLQYRVLCERHSRLSYARRKCTQKVNLFEKVQIPGYEEAIIKIKRYMEDEDNLSKSSQKIVKQRRV